MAKPGTGVDYLLKGIPIGDLEAMKTLSSIVLHCEMLLYRGKVIFLHTSIFYLHAYGLVDHELHGGLYPEV